MSWEDKPGQPSLVVPFLALATAVSAVVVVAIIGFLGYFSLPLLHAGALSTLMSWRWEPTTGHFGILAMLCGTLFTALPALALAFPLAIGVVALANGLAPRPLAKPLLMLVQFMTSIPTVAWAFVSAFLVVPEIRTLTDSSGYCWLAVVLTLAILVLPTIVLVLCAPLRQLPESLHLTACALGFDRAQYLLYVAFPQIRASFLAALALGCGRAIGDTLIALMVSGNAPIVPHLPTDSLRTLTAHIALVLATDSQSSAYASLFAAGLLLCLVVITLNLGLLVVRSRSDD